MIDQRWALIAHLDVLGAIEGRPSCDLVLVDLTLGHEAAELCLAAKAWERRSDVFSVARAEEIVTGEGEHLAQPKPAGTPVTPTPAEQQAAIASEPDEGGDGDPIAFDVLQARYRRIDGDGRLWMVSLTQQAQQAGVSFHSHGARTRRRFELIRAIVTLAEAGVTDDELRAVVATVIGDCALFPAVTPGHAVGSLDADQAATFARRCDLLATTTVPVAVDDDGCVRLRFPAEVGT